MITRASGVSGRCSTPSKAVPAWGMATVSSISCPRGPRQGPFRRGLDRQRTFPAPVPVPAGFLADMPEGDIAALAQEGLGPGPQPGGRLLGQAQAEQEQRAGSLLEGAPRRGRRETAV